MSITQVKLSAGGVRNPVTMSEEKGRYYLDFGYNKALIDTVKRTFEGRKFHGYEDPPRKQWSIPVDSEHNQFQLQYLQGNDPYKHYSKKIELIRPKRQNLHSHQVQGISFTLERRHCILAYEMGTGKTLIAISVLEELAFLDCWYVAPKSALVSARLDFRKWNTAIEPRFMTYEAMVKAVENWKTGDPAPRAVIFDEASRLKTPTSKRSQAAYHLAKSIRKEHGRDSLILLMSGSPAPKSPGDWYWLCHIACPGFLTDGSIQEFQKRYALMRTEDYGTGAFNRLVAWKDSNKRCAECGEGEDKEQHLPDGYKFKHYFVPMENEVVKLYKRMAGLVDVKFKKDCLDLPEKIYKVIRCPVAPEIKRAAMLLKKGCKTVIEALTRCRELSDGFQYLQKVVGSATCEHCKGSKFILEKDNEVEGQFNEVPCTFCGATGERKIYEDVTEEFPCGKDDVITELLEDHEDVGRIVLYAGFTASIDRTVRICERNGWAVVRVDGRGVYSKFGNFDESVEAFQNKDIGEKIAFVGHADSAGMGLTLTASPTIVFVSNSFKAESRIQAEDRIHRIGMDTVRGALIIDLIALETDQYVLDNLKMKRELQSITLGELSEATLEFDAQDVEFR